MDRRQFLLGAAAAPLASGAAPEEKKTRSPAPGSGGLMRAVVTIGGKTYTYEEGDGEDLGDFHGPGFIQRCVRVMRPDIPLTVFFRPDRDSDRTEVVFELGRLWGRANAEAANLDRYHVRIERGGKKLTEIDVPKHWWFSAWRWQSALRPVIRKTSDLIKAGLLLPYGDRLAKYANPTTPVRYGGPMDSAGIYKAMGSTGERPDLGPVTEWQADYIVTGNRAALGTLLIQGEAAGSIPWHMRDENTGAPVDFFANPLINWYFTGSGPNWVKGTKTDWHIDTAHEPALAYVPYILTGDPYYLEKLQFQSTWDVGWTSYHRSIQKLQIVYPGQTRAYAWGLRSLMQLATVTPENVPRWLLPQSYWKRILDDNLSYFTRTFVEDQSPPSSVFRAATMQSSVGSWQECYLAVVIGWGVLLGHEQWRHAFEWKVGSTIALTDGKSGWNRQWCSPYYYQLKSSKNELLCRSWKEAWENFKKDPANKVVEPLHDGKTWAQTNGFSLLLYTWATLNLATRLGVEGAQNCLEFVDEMVVNGLENSRGSMLFRWAIERRV